MSLDSFVTSPFHACTHSHVSCYRGPSGQHLESDVCIEGEADVPLAVVLVDVQLEEVPLPVGPQGHRLHVGAELGLGRHQPRPRHADTLQI